MSLKAEGPNPTFSFGTWKALKKVHIFPFVSLKCSCDLPAHNTYFLLHFHSLSYLIWNNKTTQRKHGKSRNESSDEEVLCLFCSQEWRSQRKNEIHSETTITTERFLAGLSCEEGESPEALWNEWLDWGLFNWLLWSGWSFLKTD